jgi:hypothetical protein
MMFSSIFLIIPCFTSSVQRRKRKDIGHQHIPPAIPRAADILASAMLAQHGPVPEISITFDPATRSYGFSTRRPGMRPHWMIDTFASLEDVMRWVDPWRERVWEEPGEADESRILESRSEKPGVH